MGGSILSAEAPHNCNTYPYFATAPQNPDGMRRRSRQRVIQTVPLKLPGRVRSASHDHVCRTQEQTLDSELSQTPSDELLGTTRREVVERDDAVVDKPGLPEEILELALGVADFSRATLATHLQGLLAALPYLDRRCAGFDDEERPTGLQNATKLEQGRKWGK